MASKNKKNDNEVSSPPIFASHDSKGLNPLWLSYMESKDSLFLHYQAYFLSGPTVNPSMLCSAPVCTRRSQSAAFHDLHASRTVFEPMLLCFTCNRISHVKCNGLTIETFKEQHLPWTCKHCQSDIHNPIATAYMNETSYELPLKARRKHFLRAEAAADPIIIGDDEEIEFDEVDTQAFSKEYDSWTAFHTAADVSHLEKDNRALREELERIKAELESTKRSSTSQQQNYSEIFRKNSTTMPGDTSSSFDFSRHFNQSSYNFDQSRNNASSQSETNTPNTSSRQNYTTTQADVSEVLNRFTITQQQLLDEQLLSTRRKMMPKITDFDGDATKWIEFSQDVERYQRVLKYDDETIKLHLRGALKGQAFEAVKSVFNLLSLQQLIEILKNDFGDPMLVVAKSEKALKEYKLKGELFREDALKLRQLIQGYFSSCIYANTGYLNSNYLADQIYRQFRQDVRIKIREFFVSKHPNKVVVLDLSIIHDFLLSYIPLLDPKAFQKTDTIEAEKRNKANQINYTVSASNSKDKDATEWKFQISNKEAAPYLGYDMQKVNGLKKCCLICNKTNHFTLACYQYKQMSEAQRLNTINEKNICQNCVLSNTHTASSCELKLSCGFIIGGRKRCTAKHHVSIHRILSPSNSYNGPNRNKFQKPKNGNTNKNTENAKKAQENAENANNNAVGSVSRTDSSPQSSIQSSFCAHETKQYQMRDGHVGVIQINVHAAHSFQKTVKMFENNFYGPNGVTTAFSVGDSAAEVTLVREDLRKALGINGTPQTLNITWTDKSIKLCNAIKFDLQVQGVHKNAKVITLKDCYAINDLNLPTRTLDMNLMRSLFPHLKGIPFNGYYNEQPVMLIGTTHAAIIENIGKLRSGSFDEPIGIETVLGFSVFGGNPDIQYLDTTTVAQTNIEDATFTQELFEAQGKITNEDLYVLLKRFNAVESIGIKAAGHYIIEEERKAIEILQEELCILDDGTVEVPLVWNRDKDKKIPKLPNNYSVALKRQLALEKKLAKTPDYWQGYKKNVKELLELNYMRKATTYDLTNVWPNTWYLPMGLVVNANKNPPKLRNVYDARSRYANKSLNDMLLKGPDMLINLATPLLCSRLNKIAFSADVKHMFHRIQICLRDQQCQRVLYRDDTNKPMETYILNRMAFGPKCSPFVSQYVKNWNADRWFGKYPEAAKAVKESVYMDDVLLSEVSVHKAVNIAKQLIEIFKYINWELVSFQSNSKEFLRQLPNQYIKNDLIPLLEDEQTEHITKVLGCSWNTTEDVFLFQLDKNIFIKLMTEFEHKPTKKDLASLIARIFDIMGFIAHYTIRGKIILQRTWKTKIGWDEAVSNNILNEWKSWLADIKEITKIRIPRMISQLDAIQNAEKLELHSFCDAGIEAFGAVTYLVVHANNQVTSRILMAKAKVTPLRFHTETEIKEIPRLELMSALLAARLSKTIVNAYKHLPITKFFWSDSEVVLRWILNPNHRLLKYAIGPIEEILEVSARNDWKYVPSALNPADICTKFKKFDFGDAKSIWYIGPEFIKRPRDEWPQLPEKLMLKEHAIVYNIYLQQLNYSTHQLPPIELDELIDRLSDSIKSSWNKLRRAVARALKILLDGLIPAIKSRQFHDVAMRMEIKQIHNGFKLLTPIDFERAEHFIFRKLQREHFTEEYQLLKLNRRIKNKEFQRLNVFMDQEGLLRINSRANLNDLSYPQQFAPLVPRKEELTYALLRSIHIKYDHIALESQIAEIRTRCWIPKLRQALKVVKSRCNECKLREAQMYEPTMAPLPKFRINPAQRPFEVVAVDCFGPYIVKCNGRNKKIWVVIFTCTLTRYLHLHILESLESIQVLEAIVVFWTSYGPVAKFVSDNGTNFQGASNILLDDIQKDIASLKKLQNSLSTTLAEKYFVEWEFIPPYSPWMGGVYERLIREVKRALYEILNKRKIEKIELNIAIHEVSHRLNLRPLTYNSMLADDGEVLTPHHLAKNKSGWPLLPGIHKGQYGTISNKDLYRKGRALADQIMAKFTKNYLPEYARRSKWFADKKEIQKDDIVLIIEPNNTRQEFFRGRVVKIFPSVDGKGRKAEIALANRKTKICSVRNLARLDISI